MTLIDLGVGERARLVGRRRGLRVAVDDVEGERAVLGGDRAAAEEIEDRDRLAELARRLADRGLDRAREHVVVHDDREVAARRRQRGDRGEARRLRAQRLERLEVELDDEGLAAEVERALGARVQRPEGADEHVADVETRGATRMQVAGSVAVGPVLCTRSAARAEH